MIIKDQNTKKEKYRQVLQDITQKIIFWNIIVLISNLLTFFLIENVIYIFTNHSTISRMWHKVNFLSRV